MYDIPLDTTLLNIEKDNEPKCDFKTFVNICTFPIIKIYPSFLIYKICSYPRR